MSEPTRKSLSRAVAPALAARSRVARPFDHLALASDATMPRISRWVLKENSREER